MARPRSIPEEEVVERALRLFWERGYDRTSMSDLSAAIGVGPSSIYNSFGSKGELFRRAIARYAEFYAGPTLQLLDSDEDLGAVEFARKLMTGLARLYTTKGQPLGCAIFQSGGSDSSADSEGTAITAEVKERLIGALRRRFVAFAEGGEELSATPVTLARFILGNLCGISQLACDGVGRRGLLEVVDHAAESVLSRS